MIDSNKLLSKNQVSRGRNIVTIKRNLIKINNLLKERLVLTKVRQGIMMQEEENRIRRQREDDLESLEPTRKIEDDKPKDDKKNSGLLAALATLGLLFLPGLKKLLNFLNDIKDRVGNMAKLLLKAMTDFKDKAFAFLNEVNLANFDKEKIQTSFAKLEKDLKNFVNTLVFAAVTNFAVSTLGKLSGVNIQNLIRRGRKTKVDDVLDDVPDGEGGVPFEFGTITKKPKGVEVFDFANFLRRTRVKTPVRKKPRVTVGKDLLKVSKLEKRLDRESMEVFERFYKFIKKTDTYKTKGLSKKDPLYDNTIFELQIAKSAFRTMAESYNIQMNKATGVLKDVYVKYIKNFDDMADIIQDIIDNISKPNNTKSIEQLLRPINFDKLNKSTNFIEDVLEQLGKSRVIKKKYQIENPTLDDLMRQQNVPRNIPKKFLGGLATLGTYKLGEQGPEFIIDADSTLAIENTAPGFLNALNQAEGFQSIDVLRNYASYEGGHLQTASFFPVFIPSPSNKKSQIMLAVSGGNGSRQTVFSKIHDKR